jgi:hypothetical protein
MEVHPVGNGLLHADSQINTTKVAIALCNFVNTPKETVHSMKKYKDTLIKRVSSSLFTSGTYLLHGAVLLEKLTGSQLVNSPHFMEPKGSLPCLQKPTTCTYPELTSHTSQQ